MKKSNYMVPTTEVVELNAQNIILTGSGAGGGETPGGDIPGGDTPGGGGWSGGDDEGF